MRTLFRRELRRLLPYGLGVLALALLAGPLSVTFGGSSDTFRLLVLALAPAILGVATVAPDTSSGGTAFLARLPVSPAAALAVKILAALIWSLPSIAAAACIICEIGPEHGLPDGAWLMRHGLQLFGITTYAVFSFACGLLASVVAHRAMPAILMAPSLAVALSLALCATPALVFTVPLGGPNDSFFAHLACLGLGVSLALIGVGFVAHGRGDRHRTSSRPALIAVAGVVLILLLGFGTTAGAYAWSLDHAAGDLRVEPAETTVSPDGRLVALVSRGTLWTGAESRVVLVERRTGAAWLIPRRAERPRFSPDSRTLLVVAAAEPGGWLVDVASHALTRVPGSPGSSWGRGFDYAHVAWVDARPVFFRQTLDGVEGWDPTAAGRVREGPALPPGVSLLAVTTEGRAVFSYSTGGGEALRVAAVPDLLAATGIAGHDGGRSRDLKLEAAVAFPAGRTLEATFLSPSGRRAVMASSEGHGLGAVIRWGLSVGDLARHTSIDLERTFHECAGLDRVAPWDHPTRADWSPGEDRVAVSLADGSITLFETATGRRAGRLSDQGNERVLVCWSPSGNLLAVPGGRVTTAGGTPAASSPLPVAAFLDEDRVIPGYEPLVYRSLSTGQVAHPLEAR